MIIKFEMSPLTKMFYDGLSNSFLLLNNVIKFYLKPALFSQNYT
jgi:hypothetical protein